MNGYTITNIDGATGAVYATFVLDDKILNETIFVEDVSNVDVITKALEEAYVKFQADVEVNSPVSAELTAQVSDLIGKSVDATTFDTLDTPIDNLQQ